MARAVEGGVDLLKAWVDNDNGGKNYNEGVSLKSADLWINGGGSDDYSWGGLPGGILNNGNFNHQGNETFWWSMTESTTTEVWRYSLGNYTVLYDYVSNKSLFSLSLRCVKD